MPWPWLKPKETKPLKLDAGMIEIGATGIDIVAGKVDDLLTKKLRSYDTAVRVYRDMRDFEPVVGGILFSIDMLCRRTKWWVEPFSRETQDIQRADFLDTCRHDMNVPWSDFISEVLTMLPYGFSVQELVYKVRGGPEAKKNTHKSKYNDGRIGWRKISIRAQESITEWDVDENGGVHGVYQTVPTKIKDVYIPIEKLLHFRTTAEKANPEGRSILLNAVMPWYRKKMIEEIEGIGIERDLAGFPVFYVPSGWTSDYSKPEERALGTKTEKIARNIRNDEQTSLVLPSIYDKDGNRILDFKLISSPGQKQFNTNEVINRYKADIAITTLTSFILFGLQKVGTYSLHESAARLFSIALNAWLDSIADILNRFAVPRLWKFNGFPLDRLPRIVHGKVETPDLQELGKFLNTLAGAGMQLFPDEALENMLRDYADLPKKEGEE